MNDDVRTVIPRVPVWAVYWDNENDTVFTSPVLWFESRWGKDEDGVGSFDLFNSMSFSSDGWIETDKGADNFLGLSLTEAVTKEGWGPEIERVKRSRRPEGRLRSRI